VKFLGEGACKASKSLIGHFVEAHDQLGCQDLNDNEITKLKQGSC